MLSKKGLSPIVANVLIILLVIAAVGILWGVVRGLVDSGAEQATTQTDCLLINMEVVSCDVTNGVVVRRNAGGPTTPVEFRVFATDGVPSAYDSGATNTLDQVETFPVPTTGTPSFAPVATDTVQVAARLSSGDYCNPTQQPVACS